MLQAVVRVICIVIIWLGIILIFDARNLTNRFFGFGDQNEGANGIKILGFIIVIVTGIIMMVFKL